MRFVFLRGFSLHDTDNRRHQFVHQLRRSGKAAKDLLGHDEESLTALRRNHLLPSIGSHEEELLVAVGGRARNVPGLGLVEQKRQQLLFDGTLVGVVTSQLSAGKDEGASELPRCLPEAVDPEGQYARDGQHCSVRGEVLGPLNLQKLLPSPYEKVEADDLVVRLVLECRFDVVETWPFRAFDCLGDSLKLGCQLDLLAAVVCSCLRLSTNLN